jgi:hypothetical protein
VTELEAALRDLGAHLEVPEPPETAALTAAVRTRLAAPAPRPVWVKVAAVLVVLLLAFAVLVTVSPPVRAGVLHLLRFAGIEFDSGPASPPPLPSTAPLPDERTVDLDTARSASAFPIALPDALGQPERVLLADGTPPRVVSLLYQGGRVRLDEFDGRIDPVLYKKLVVSGDLTSVNVGEDSGLWVDRPHEVTYVDRNGVYHTESARLSGKTLIWQHGGITLRLEGDFGLAEAQDIAASVR